MLWHPQGFYLLALEVYEETVRIFPSQKKQVNKGLLIYIVYRKKLTAATLLESMIITTFFLLLQSCLNIAIYLSKY